LKRDNEMKSTKKVIYTVQGSKEHSSLLSDGFKEIHALVIDGDIVIKMRKFIEQEKVDEKISN
jgi:hypothetical protein